jgi:addiction module RelE/StbE family toxin
MAFLLYIAPRAKKVIDNLTAHDQVRVNNAIGGILQDPYSAKPLHGKREGQYAVRVWPYRVVYKIYKEKRVILIIEFGHRQGVYK